MYNYNKTFKYTLLQNLYIGYKTTLEEKSTEIDLSTRNLAQTKNTLVAEGLVASFGCGVKVDL